MTDDELRGLDIRIIEPDPSMKNLSAAGIETLALRKLADAYDDLRKPAPGRPDYARLAERAVTEPGVQEAARAGIVAGLAFGRLLLALDLVLRLGLVPGDAPFVVDEEGGSEPTPGVMGGLPLPFTHINFQAADGLRGARVAGEQVGRLIERTLVNGWQGVRGDLPPGEGVWGLTTFPHRVMIPTAGEGPSMGLLRARDHLYGRRYFGPYALVAGPGWDASELAAARPEGTEHLVITPALPPRADLLLVQLTPDVVRLVLGAGPVVTDEGEGRRRLVVVAVPQLRADWQGCGGVAHVTP